MMRDLAFRAAAEEHDRQIRPYHGNVALVRARGRVPQGYESIDWDLGWAGLLPHDAPFFGVDGDHLGILVEPGTAEIALIIRQQLALDHEAARSGSASTAGTQA